MEQRIQEFFCYNLKVKFLFVFLSVQRFVSTKRKYFEIQIWNAVCHSSLWMFAISSLLVHCVHPFCGVSPSPISFHSAPMTSRDGLCGLSSKQRPNSILYLPVMEYCFEGDSYRCGYFCSMNSSHTLGRTRCILILNFHITFPEFW